MNNFRNRLAQFMMGRYGMDETFYVLLISYIVLMFINLFVHTWIIQILGIAIFVYAVFRFFSKNIAKRTRENQRVMNVLYGAKGFVNKRKNRSAQKKSCFFKKCPNCGKTLRLPRVKGKHNTRCPSCGCEFSVRILKGKR
ncbi:MAG: hypothetical protein LUI06_00295 [Ruminococcus sp.]|nr:hypothetical protein [Ruminococcus sp.]